MTDQWQELKETIIELRDNDGTGTQQEVCTFLANYMDILEKQMQESVVSKQAVLNIVDSYSESQSNVEDVTQDIISDIVALPSVNPQPCEELDFVQPHKKFPVNLEACKMREATQEEREGIEQYIDSISIAESCGDAISREDALMCLTGEIKETDTIETIIARSGRRIRKLPSVKPQEPCEDAISRQEAVEAFQMFREYESNRSNEGWVNRIETVLNQLPPVNSQPKTGHWIDDKCSICGKGIEDLIDSREWYRNEEPNFCPFCGLKLVDSQESEEQK